MRPSHDRPTDSFASIVAELRKYGGEDQFVVSDSRVIADFATRIERLDAEMRKKLVEYWEDPSNVTADVQDELKQLRARLAACEKDAERYRWLRENGHRLNDRYPWTGDRYFPSGEILDVEIDAALASVPKDAATGDEGKSP